MLFRSSHLEIIVMVLGITGILFNIQKSPVGFALWIPSNIIMIWVSRKRWPIALLFSVYTLTSVWGLIQWVNL